MMRRRVTSVMRLAEEITCLPGSAEQGLPARQQPGQYQALDLVAVLLLQDAAVQPHPDLPTETAPCPT